MTLEHTSPITDEVSRHARESEIRFDLRWSNRVLPLKLCCEREFGETEKPQQQKWNKAEILRRGIDNQLLIKGRERPLEALGVSITKEGSTYTIKTPSKSYAIKTP
jgi:hypothetical protein